MSDTPMHQLARALEASEVEHRNLFRLTMKTTAHHANAAETMTQQALALCRVLHRALGDEGFELEVMHPVTLRWCRVELADDMGHHLHTGHDPAQAMKLEPDIARGG